MTCYIALEDFSGLINSEPRTHAGKEVADKSFVRHVLKLLGPCCMVEWCEMVHNWSVSLFSVELGQRESSANKLLYSVLVISLAMLR